MANGQETGIETLRAGIARQARRNDWNSVREFHQGQRSATAIKGRIHDRTPTRLPKHQKALAERGPSIHDSGENQAMVLSNPLRILSSGNSRPMKTRRLSRFSPSFQ